MKLLDNARLSGIAAKISDNAIDCALDFRLEPYSCKMISTDKKSWRHVSNGGTSPEVQLPISTSLNVTNTLSTYGRLRHYSERSLSGSDNDAADENFLPNTVSRKTLFNLCQALNTSFPDYDFSNTNCGSFTSAHYDKVVEVVNEHLRATVDNYGFVEFELWNSIEEEIKPRECAIYSYQSASSSPDPFNEGGVLWSLNYFFYNKQLKRILYLSCRALHMQNSDEDDQDEDWDME